MRWILRIIFVLFLGAIVLGAAAWYRDRAEKPAVAYRTAKVTRSDLLSTISATGTVEPEEVVDVGAQVAGQIISFGKDIDGKTVDYGSHIKQGMMLAQLDDAVYQSDLLSAKAQLAAANAGVTRAQADLLQSQAKLELARQDWDRAQRLGVSEALAQSQYDTYKSAYESAKANVGVSEAAIVSAQASVEQADASVKRVERNLGFTVINSPVDGTIIDRRVNIGQTVVASLNAPSLFLIAKDLHRMQVWVAVNEADIGQVRPGQPVTFTCDAFPGQKFQGQVGKVRLNATMTQNVVTYTVEVTTENPDGKLLPYLTANVAFEVGRRENALVVPNAALRYVPRPELIAQEESAGNGGPTTQASASSSGRQGRGGGRGGRGGRGNGGANANGGGSGMAAAGETANTTQNVWVQTPTGLKPVSVKLGLVDSDRGLTEVLSDNLPEGTEVVTGEQRETTAAASPGGAASPFIPTFPARGGRRGGGGG
jgi:HlyD family secretion protein